MAYQQNFYYHWMNNEATTVSARENMYDQNAATGVTIEPLPVIEKKKPMDDNGEVVASSNNQPPVPPAYSPPQHQLPKYQYEASAFDNAAFGDMMEVEEKKAPVDGFAASASGTNLSEFDNPWRAHAEEFDNKVNTTKDD
jgi:hypothetical protein